VLAIPSARTVDHLLDSVGAADLVLGADELAAIDAGDFSRA
jgi:aryl-alcohol dehydrogenase-like predicted oxidoreductase